MINLNQAFEKYVTEQIQKMLPHLKPNEQVQTLLKLMNYIYPKRKAIEVTDSSPDSKVEVSTIEPKIDYGVWPTENLI